MASGKKKKKEKDKGIALDQFKEHLKVTEKNRGILAIIFFVIAIILFLPAFGAGGVAGAFVYSFLHSLVGVGYYLIPLLFFSLAIAFARAHEGFPTSKVIAGVLALLAALGMVGLVSPEQGGYLGAKIASPLVYLFDLFSTFLILAAVFIIAVLLLFDIELTPEVFRIPGLDKLRGMFSIKKKDEFAVTGVTEVEDEYEEYEDEEAPVEPVPVAEQNPDRDQEPKIVSRAKEEFDADRTIAIRSVRSEYVAPPLSLLEKDRGKPGTGDIKANANIIRRTLQNFGIQVEMDEVSIGPSVTRYAIKPAEGVRLSKIVSLQNNLELALAAYPVRIEAPIPGKSLVGIEVPNTSKATVGLASLFASPEFAESGKQLLIGLGRDISGLAHFANIARMPHLLIAGATGSGKSVAIHTLITSLIYRNGPDEMRFIMIDPKRVELTLYNGIPHLLTPVITDAKKAIMSLKWATKEMERRYNVLETEKVQNIDSYHKKVYGPARAKITGNDDSGVELPESMPYIVVVVDELADIMQAYPRELEAAIVRLAQMSRAVGIHLVLSTQRPSVNVITGLIKANVPARLALQVASQIDSRTIIDGSGAEKLLGAGDMLYLSGDMGKPHRIQGAFIGEEEVKNVVNFIKKNNEPILDDIDFGATGGSGDGQGIFAGSAGDDEDDDLYDDAKAVVEEAGKASTSYIQRKLRVGYSRAARLLDLLEKRGVVGPADGSKAREVIGRSPNPSADEDV